VVCAGQPDQDDPSWWDEDSFLMAIDLGYDESGSCSTLLVSVQLGVYEQAKKLKRQWKSRLCDAGVKYFHSKEFNFSHGVFAGLNRTQRESLLRDLSKLIHRHLSIGMTAKITPEIYNQKTTQDFRSTQGTAYTYAVQMLLTASYAYAVRDGVKLRPEFNILIEDGHRSSPQALQSLQDVKKKGLAFPTPSKILSVGLGSKPDHPILQAADMLAYSVCQRINNIDSPIYNALHHETSSYQPEFIDFDKIDLVETSFSNVQKWLADRKAFGRQRAKEIEAAQQKAGSVTAP
jgi:hypothetical protein